MKVFGSKAPKIFELPLDSTSDSIVDVVRKQWKMYQLEHITESMYMVENETRKNNIPNSYWNYALEHSGLFQERPMEESRYVRIDIYWNSINGILNEFGKPKYTEVFALVKAILSLSHGNVVSKGGFPINKYLLSIHENSIGDKTIVALRLVKDFICSEGGFSNIITKGKLLQSVKSSHSRYQIYLEVQRKLNENEEKLRLEEEKEVLLMKERESRRKFCK